MGKARYFDQSPDAKERRAKRDGAKHDLERASLARPEIQAAADKASLRDWERDPLADIVGDMGAPVAADVLRGLMQVCLPPKTYGDRRRFRSGYIRLVAFAWRLAPELLDGCAHDKDVAELLGITAAAFCNHLAAVDVILARSSRVRRR